MQTYRNCCVSVFDNACASDIGGGGMTKNELLLMRQKYEGRQECPSSPMYDVLKLLDALEAETKLADEAEQNYSNVLKKFWDIRNMANYLSCLFDITFMEL